MQNIIIISSSRIMKKCDDPIKGSGSGPKENVLQYGSAASSPFTVLVMVMRNTEKWDVMNIRIGVNYNRL